MDARVPGFMRDLALTVTTVLRERLGDLPRDQAEEIGMEASQRVCRDYGGELIYVPTGYSLRIAERDREMYRWYIESGRNVVATARWFETTTKTVYERVRLVEATDFARRQGKLFSDPA